MVDTAMGKEVLCMGVYLTIRRITTSRYFKLNAYNHYYLLLVPYYVLFSTYNEYLSSYHI